MNGVEIEKLFLNKKIKMHFQWNENEGQEEHGHISSPINLLLTPFSMSALQISQRAPLSV